METIPQTFDQALALLAVVEHGSFTAAAERSGVSKAHVSKQVGALEAALGVRLLQRTTRRLALTDAGRLYADGNSVMVWIERASGRPVPLPGAIRAACAGAA